MFFLVLLKVFHLKHNYRMITDHNILFFSFIVYPNNHSMVTQDDCQSLIDTGAKVEIPSNVMKYFFSDIIKRSLTEW